MDAEKIYESVLDRYSAAAHGGNARHSHFVAKAFGYSEEELASIPKDANLGLSCGNPVAIASLQQGETVIDLGCGAGFDAFMAANKVGPPGNVYGVDMNKDMILRANNARAEASKDNVSFVESKITDIPLESGIADCIISNCVINLVPGEEKQPAFNEMFRFLKPGGRLAISDILLKKALPDNLQTCMALYTGCIAGASQVADYQEYLKVAGFKETLITDTNADLNVYLETDADEMMKSASEQGGHTSQCCGIATKDETAASCQGGQAVCCSDKNTEGATGDVGCGGCGGKLLDDLNEWAGSYKIFAVKV